MLIIIPEVLNECIIISKILLKRLCLFLLNSLKSLLIFPLATWRPLNNAISLKDYLEDQYENSAQYNDPTSHPVETLCNGIDGAADGTDVLTRIFAGVQAVNGKLDCLDVEYNNINDTIDNRLGWIWQVRIYPWLIAYISA